MTSIIRKLKPSEIPSFVEIAINAYPGASQNTDEYKERLTTTFTTLQEADKAYEFYGIFRDEKLVGGMRINYFEMNLHSRIIEVGGVGTVAVDLLHKKEKVAKELMTFFIHHFIERGVSLVALYPFRPDFYKKMGFGYGTKMNYYQLKPASFPAKGSKKGLVFLNETHKELIRDCYNRYAYKTHGMMVKTDREMDLMFKNPDHKLVGYIHDGKLEGYILFTFKKMSDTNFVHNNLIIKEWIFENQKSLSSLSAFLHSQSDQITRIEWMTQDDAVEYLVSDPRNGSNRLIPSVYHETFSAGVGLMYRIVNVVKFIQDMSHFNFGMETITVGINVIDSFIEENSQRLVVEFVKGKASVVEQDIADVDITFDISDLSSLFMGAATFQKLYQYGRVEVSHLERLPQLIQLFTRMEKPLCTTAF